MLGVPGGMFGVPMGMLDFTQGNVTVRCNQRYLGVCTRGMLGVLWDM